MRYCIIIFLSILVACESSDQQIPMTCSFVAPAENAVISNDVPLNISVTTSTLADKVEIYFDNQIIGTLESSPYEFTWTPIGRVAGNHVLKAIASKWHEEATSTTQVFINFKLGETSQGGTVYYIDETGRHGLVVAHQDLTFGNQTRQFWGPEFFIGATDSVDGNLNTTTLANAPIMETYFWNRFKLGYTYNGYSDWYVPSKKELLLLSDCMDEFESSDPAFLHATYWTSTECCRAQACAVDFIQKKAITVLKADSVFNVRPVRKF